MATDSAWLQQIWYGSPRPPLWLQAAEVVYKLLRPMHRQWQKIRSGHPGVPVIIVGNITVGGTGKTPLLIELVRLLAQAGYRPGVVSRGYGADAGKDLREVNATSTSAQVGDEPMLIWQQTGVPVVVGRNRLAAARQMAGQHDIDLVLSDDGLQHERLQRDIEIAVVDGERGVGNGHQLPAGPLRDSPDRLKSVDFVVTNGGDQASMRVTGDKALNLVSGAERDLASFAGEPLHAVAAIGAPDKFFAMLKDAGLAPQCHPLPDHYAYSDAAEILALPGVVLTTSKDAVKLTGKVADGWWQVPVTAELDAEFTRAFLTRVKQVTAGD